jgi:hypothetical protein
MKSPKVIKKMPLNYFQPFESNLLRERPEMEARMQTEPTSFFEWQTRFSTEEACVHFLVERRWPDGFLCACCGHEKAHFIRIRRVYRGLAAGTQCR